MGGIYAEVKLNHVTMIVVNSMDYTHYPSAAELFREMADALERRGVDASELLSADITDSRDNVGLVVIIRGQGQA
jgi:hypothetical protein